MSESRFFSLKDKVTLITGAARGIGLAITERFLSAGARVVLVDMDSEEATRTARRLDSAGQKTLVVAVDIRKEAETLSMVRLAVERFGTIDILVNNAGIIRRSSILDFTEKDWDDVLQINQSSLFFLSQAFAKRLVKQNQPGKIKTA